MPVFRGLRAAIFAVAGSRSPIRPSIGNDFEGMHTSLDGRVETDQKDARRAAPYFTKMGIQKMPSVSFLCAVITMTVLGGLPSNLRAEGRDNGVAFSRDEASVLQAFERATVALFERASVSVVQIAAVVGDAPKSQIKFGSGFFWDAAGHIVTCAHVVQDAKEITVWLTSNEQVEAEIVGLVSRFDLAVLRAKGLKRPATPIAIGTSNNLKIGQLAFAIGSPLGLDQSLTSGVISALKRYLPTGKGRSITDVIQTDAAVHPGNSGGPLLNSSGQLIGVNTIAYSIAELGSSLGFAVPVDTVRRIVPELIQKRRIPTPGIGIVPLSEAIAVESDIEGVMIAEIRPGSPAERARLQAKNAATNSDGDVIVAANGETVQNVFELTEQLEKLGVGANIILKIKRGEQLLDVEIEIIDLDQKS
jgi:2-alkenal reductase